LPFECPRFSTQDISRAAALPVGDPFRSQLTKDLIASLHQYHFVVLECSPEENQVQQQVLDMMKEFFDRPKAEKKAYQSTEESFGSGWSELVFDNRDSIRDKEIREVFQVRMGTEGNTPWPDSHFKEVSYTHYRQQWDLCRTYIVCHLFFVLGLMLDFVQSTWLDCCLVKQRDSLGMI